MAMEVGGAHLAGGGGGGGGGNAGPAPFLQKTYEMVDDPATDGIVSWSDSSDSSFVVWRPPEFAARLLPTYFKHNNFSSFIRQLNTYGFRKIDPERWEFANDHFIKGQKHLLKSIHRRKPIHSHSHQPGSLPDAERTALEEEIDRLTRERAALQADLWRFKQQQSGAMIQIEDLERRVLDMEQRQLKMVAFLQHASKNTHFIDNLVKMVEASTIFTDAIHKRRRLPGLDHCNEVAETSFYDNHSSTSKQDMGNLFNQDFCDKLRLELCPAMTESNLITASTQSSHEDNGSPHGKYPECERTRMECLPLVPETLELSDTGTSICPSKNACAAGVISEDGLLPCHLSLTLASSSMEIDRSQNSNPNVSTIDEGTDNPMDTRDSMNKENGLGRLLGNGQKASGDTGTGDVTTTSREDAQVANETPAAPPAVVNDKFWEQFLTERPGSSDTEEASSTLRRNPSGEQPEDSNQRNDGTWSNRKDMEQLKL